MLIIPAVSRCHHGQFSHPGHKSCPTFDFAAEKEKGLSSGGVRDPSSLTLLGDSLRSGEEPCVL